MNEFDEQDKLPEGSGDRLQWLKDLDGGKHLLTQEDIDKKRAEATIDLEEKDAKHKPIENYDPNNFDTGKLVEPTTDLPSN